MTPFRRALAVAVVLLSQVASGFAVLCEEGSGGRMFEVFPGVCCDETVDGTPAAAQAPAPEPASAPDAPHDCGACRDEALTRLLPGHADERELTLPPSPQERCALLAPCAPPTVCAPPQAGHDAQPASTVNTAAQLSGVVVLLC